MNRHSWRLLLIVGFATGCAYVAVQSAPEKSPSMTRSKAAEQADGLFWETLHDGQYDQISLALNALTAAYLENPNDAITAAGAAVSRARAVAQRYERIKPPTNFGLGCRFGRDSDICRRGARVSRAGESRAVAPPAAHRRVARPVRWA